MHHAVDVEIHNPEQEVRIQELPGREQAEQHLRHEKRHRHDEVLHRQPLAGAQRRVVHPARGHDSLPVARPPWGSAVKPDGKPLVSMADIHFR